MDDPIRESQNPIRESQKQINIQKNQVMNKSAILFDQLVTIAIPKYIASCSPCEPEPTKKKYAISEKKTMFQHLERSSKTLASIMSDK